jgi:hypothetical protein
MAIGPHGRKQTWRQSLCCQHRRHAHQPGCSETITGQAHEKRCKKQLHRHLNPFQELRQATPSLPVDPEREPNPLLWTPKKRISR